jgi:hypothetical protein
VKLKSAILVRAGRLLFLLLLIPNLSQAQAVTTLSGAITDSSGRGVADAKVSVKSIATGQSTQTQTDSSGQYSVPNLEPGDYVVTASADGFAAKAANVTLTGANPLTVNLILTAGSTQNQAAEPQSELPNAPSSAPPPPSLGDLGFTPQQTQANTQLQAMLTKRTEMLKIHQRLGLITVIPMAAALITGPMAKAKGKNGQPITEPTTANLDFHAALGGATTALYFSTAYYAIFAPRVPGTTKHGAIRMHEALAFIHGPGMILTPVLGYMAYKQENAGEKVHGIASAHGPVAYATAAAYGASIIAVSWPIHLKFWEKQ